MKSLLSLEEIIAAVSPEIRGGAPKRFSSVGVDSRTVQAGGLFVALVGENTDGHRFVADAFDHGAAGALVSAGRLGAVSQETEERPGRDDRGPSECLLIVSDSDQALLDLGRRAIAHQTGMTRIGITGSNGKTTTKEMVGAILALNGSTFLTPGNYNSTIGIPLSVMPLESSYSYGVFEMAMNRRGEMARLAEMVKPEWALITNIGTAHIGHVGSQQAIAEEKIEIAGQFDGSQSCLIPKNDGYAEFLAQRVRGRVIFYGEGATRELESVSLEGLGGARIRWRGRDIHIKLPGRHNVHNALGALALAQELDIEPGIVVDGLESVRPLFGRGELIPGPVTLLQDCYNANPESVNAALELVAEAGWPGRVVLVLGPMKELGADAPASHAGVLQSAISFGPAAAFLYGEEYEESYLSICRSGDGQGCFWTDSFDELRDRVVRFVAPGDLVVIKGSRAAALERIGEAIRKVGE